MDSATWITTSEDVARRDAAATLGALDFKAILGSTRVPRHAGKIAKRIEETTPQAVENNSTRQSRETPAPGGNSIGLAAQNHRMRRPASANPARDPGSQAGGTQPLSGGRSGERLHR